MMMDASVGTADHCQTVSTSTQVENDDVWLDDSLREKARHKLQVHFGQSISKVDKTLVKIEREVNALKEKWNLCDLECVNAYSAFCHKAINPVPQTKNSSPLMPVLTKLQKCREAIHFLAPVDPTLLSDVEDYFDVITHPMDLHTVHTKLSTNQYANDMDFFNDVWLMFTNSWKYNPYSGYLYGDTCKLAAIFVYNMATILKESSLDYFAKIHKRLGESTSIAQCVSTFGHAITHSEVKTVLPPACSPPVPKSALAKLPEYAIRRIPGTQAIYFKFSVSSTVGGMQHIQLFRALERADVDTVQLEEVLMHKYSSNSPSLMGCVVDEVARKVYLASWVPYLGTKASNPYVQRAWLEEFELETHNGTVRARQARRRQINIDLKCPTVIECHLFIWKTTGTLMACAISIDAANRKEIPKVGVLLRKKKSDRVISAHYVDSTLESASQLRLPQFIQHKSNGVDCLTAVFNCHLDLRLYTNAAWLLQTIRMTSKPELGFEVLYEMKIAPETLWRSPLNKTIDAYDNGIRLLGRIFRAMVIASYSSIFPLQIVAVPLKHLYAKSQSTACYIILKKPFDSVSKTHHHTFLSVNASTISLSLHNSMSHIKLSSSSARQFKFYRVCANCGKREHKKRKNGKGKRISEFKVCRQCKEHGLHHDWQSRPCYYCSFECIKQDWKNHVALHQWAEEDDDLIVEV